MNEIMLAVVVSVAVAHVIAFFWIWFALRHHHHRPTPAIRKWRVTGIAPDIEDCPDDEIETLECLTVHTKDSTKKLIKANEAMRAQHGVG